MTMAPYEMYLRSGLPTGSRRLGKVIVYDYERGLLYRNGLFLRVLGPGKYRIWPFTGVSITKTDVRLTNLTIQNQKLLTADQITVTVNLTVSYRVVAPELAAHAVQSFYDQLYADAQLAARDVISAVPVDTLLTDRGALVERMLSQVRETAAVYGIEVTSVGVKDIIVSPRVRDLLMKEAETKRLAQAALLAAREEVAAMRALANAARFVEEHPSILRLRELETVRNIAQAGGNTVVLGVGATPNVAPPAQPTIREAQPRVGRADRTDGSEEIE